MLIPPTRRNGPTTSSFTSSRGRKFITIVSAVAASIIYYRCGIASSYVRQRSERGTSNTIVRHRMSNQDNKVLIQECPANRTLAINEATSSLEGFINATLHSLSQASIDITGSDRPITHLATNYNKYKTVNHGFWAEFGVYNGSTLTMAYNQLVGQQSEFNGVLAGFDSFAGLPEKWRGRFDKGAFATQYETVRESVPESVELYKGWFHDTILDFKAKHRNVPAAVIHHDGDLFLSTTITLQLLDDRIVPGTHMIFDELIGYPGYEGHEIMALWLWMNQQNATLCAMGHAGIIGDITSWRNPRRDNAFKQQSAWFQVLSRNGESRQE